MKKVRAKTAWELEQKKYGWIQKNKLQISHLRHIPRELCLLQYPKGEKLVCFKQNCAATRNCLQADHFILRGNSHDGALTILVSIISCVFVGYLLLSFFCVLLSTAFSRQLFFAQQATAQVSYQYC